MVTHTESTGQKTGVVDTVLAIAEETGVAPAQVTVAWVHEPAARSVATLVPVIGPRNLSTPPSPTTHQDPAMSASCSSPTPTPSSYTNTPTRSVILLNHLSAVLDNWDPRVVDGLAARRRVITYDNRGVGASGGSTPDTVEAMARDTVLFIRALGFEQVAGNGPAGGPDIDKVTSVTVQDMLKATLRRKDPEALPLFTQTEGGQRAARAFLAQLEERTDDRDEAISVPSFRARLKAIKR
ncbi:alpha/beta fold hydrolase [Streptomyces sp. NPDC006617]|uniref:alpha/beta fold hydrolase n=1 Tax=Streptomyces sp. NPDC006617 TaxID=3155354 RepID=UPI0033A3227F